MIDKTIFRAAHRKCAHCGGLTEDAPINNKYYCKKCQEWGEAVYSVPFIPTGMCGHETDPNLIRRVGQRGFWRSWCPECSKWVKLTYKKGRPVNQGRQEPLF